MVGSDVTAIGLARRQQSDAVRGVGVEINARNVTRARLVPLEHEMRAVIVIRVRALQAV